MSILFLNLKVKNKCLLRAGSFFGLRLFASLTFLIKGFCKRLFVPVSSVFLLALSLVLLISCTQEEEAIFSYTKQVVTDVPEQIIKVDIIYVLSSETQNKSSVYTLHEKKFIDHLNDTFFHKYNIGMELGEISEITNPELYDLRDNKNLEAFTFLSETQESYKKDRINMYIIKKSNTVAIAGMGRDQRVLITDDFLFTSTVPHEIGHALGLYHVAEEGNIMSEMQPYLRKYFTDTQVNQIKNNMNNMNTSY